MTALLAIALATGTCDAASAAADRRADAHASLPSDTTSWRRNDAGAAHGNDGGAARRNDANAARRSDADAARRNDADAARRDEADAGRRDEADAARRNDADAARRNDAEAARRTDAVPARRSDADRSRSTGPSCAPAPGDSILPMEVMIARFQAPHAPLSTFGEDAPTSRAELIARFARAVEDSSASALRALTLTPAEFAWLYFPTSRYARSPYAQPPAVTWLMVEQNSLKGGGRVLGLYGGRPLHVTAHACEEEPLREGQNRIWRQCRLVLRGPHRSTGHVRLFGSIIERAGRFRFVSLANSL